MIRGRCLGGERKRTEYGEGVEVEVRRGRDWREMEPGKRLNGVCEEMLNVWKGKEKGKH